jgi:uncharacterized membrane protein
MYRQQAQRLAERIGVHREDILVEVYQDGSRPTRWLVNVFYPATGQTLTFETESEALRALHERSAS